MKIAGVALRLRRASKAMHKFDRVCKSNGRCSVQSCRLHNKKTTVANLFLKQVPAFNCFFKINFNSCFF